MSWPQNKKFSNNITVLCAKDLYTLGDVFVCLNNPKINMRSLVLESIWCTIIYYLLQTAVFDDNLSGFMTFDKLGRYNLKSCITNLWLAV